jgi:ubiquitin C-terminal hydrolase
MIMRAVLDVQWKSTRNPHLPGPWYRCKVDHFNPHDGKHHCTYFDDDDKRWYEFKQVEKGTMAKGRNGAVDFRAYLASARGHHDIQIVEWGPHVKSIAKEFVELQRYPRRSLTHNKAHFDNLFNLIGRENRGTVQAAWNLLTAEGVPTNPERKTKLALCGASESEIFIALEVIRNSDDDNDAGSNTVDSLRAASSASASERMSHPLRQRTLTVADIDSLDESDWVELLGNGSRSPLQLLYSLRIVDSLVFPPQADTSATQLREAKNYGVRFIRSGGFVHLYKILTSGGAGALSKFGDDSLSKQCLVCLLGLFNQFYKQSSANPELQMVVIEQMQEYDLDPNFGDLAPRLLQIVETISGAVETSSSSVTSSTSSTSSSSSSSSSRINRGSNRGDYVQNPAAAAAAGTLTNNDFKDEAGEGASKSDGSYNIESNDNVFDAATTNDAPLSIEGRAVENAMGLLVSIVSRQPDVLDTLVASATASGAAVSIALLRCADRSVRIRMGSGLNRLCLSSDSSAPNVFFLGLLLGDLDLITRGEDMKYAHQSSEYFMLFEELLKRSTNLESSSPSPSDEGKMQSASSSSGGRISPADLAHRLAAAILACPIVQQSERDGDSRLHGLLGCLSALLARDSSQVGMLLKSAVGFDGGLVRHLVERCLFDAPSARTASQALKPPICKSPQLRRKAFDLLLELCRGCDTNVREVARLCGPRHVIGDKDMISASKAHRSGHTSSTVATSGSSTVVYAGAGSKTAYVDYNGTKSVSGYVGLKNMCCTCYMNSTMQNLFMVLPWRRAVLGITDVDLGDTSESIIYQTQRMYAYLQESEKQYYDPKGFCHTYKDPDDPSKPINVRIQQDASAFYGRLLHTISDKLVNTRHENILDVFNVYQVGEKFATGSDGHKYKSKRNEPTEQYVSVSVRGMKNLQTSIAKLFAGETVDFKWDKHDNESEKEELSTRKRITIKKLPPCLPLHLKRFDLDYTTFQTVKLNDRFEFPEEINMFPYTLEGRAYYDERGGAPTVLAGDNGGFASGDAAGDSGAGGKASGDGGAPPDADPAAAATASSSGSAFEESRDPMFVPASAPHPPEYYRYDLVGITIHSGNANGGHYFSYIRERDGDRRSGGQESGSGTSNGGVEKRAFKWCEFNDRRVSPWSVDRLEQDCFGGEQEQTFTDAYTGKITTTKRVKFQNAFMLFYERKAPVSTMSSSAAASADESKVITELATSVTSLAISTASSKRSEGAIEQKSTTVEVVEAYAGMPAELYEEISGQNMVEWKLRSLLDPSYAEFMQQLVGLTVESTEAKSELIKFGTRYMLGTLVHSGTKRGVARDWRTKLTKAYAGSPEASEWFLRKILDPSNRTLMDNLNNVSKSDPTPGKTSRELAKAALLAAQHRVSDMSRMTPSFVHEAMAAAGAAGAGGGEGKGNSGSKSQKQSGDAGANIPYSVQFVHKLIVMIEREPSAKWIYDIVSAFAELGAPEMQYVLRAGLLSTLLNLLDKHGIPTLWKTTASTSSASSSSRSRDESGATYAQKVARDRPVRVSQEAIILLTTLVTNCLNLDGKTRHNRTDIEATLDATSRTLISSPLFGERLMRLAFGTQVLDMTKTQKATKEYYFTQLYPYNSQAREMLTHLAWNSPEFVRILVDDVLSHYLDKLMITEPLHTIFRFVVFLITLEDELQTSRTKQVLGVVSSFVRRMLDEKILKMTAYLIHHVLMLCSDRVCSHICIPFFTQGEPLALLHDLLAWQVASPCGFGPDAVITRKPGTPLKKGQGQFYRGFVACPAEHDWDPWPELSVGGLEQLLEGKRPEMMGYDLHGNDPTSIVGRRIEVWWHKEVAMYAGQITRYNSENGKHEGEFVVVVVVAVAFLLFFVL